MKHSLVYLVLLACSLFVASVSGIGYAVRIMHDGPNCAPEHKIIHINFEVDSCSPKPLSEATCDQVYGYEKSETIACVSSIDEIKDKIPPGSTTIFAHINDRKKDCKSTTIHGSYQPVGAENSCKPGYKEDSIYLSGCSKDKFEMTVCKDMFCKSGCSVLPAMPMKEKTCFYSGGSKKTSYYYSCEIEIPTLTFQPDPEEEEDEDDDERDEL